MKPSCSCAGTRSGGPTLESRQAGAAAIIVLLSESESTLHATKEMSAPNNVN
jgi:hypothetical protein